MVVPVVVLAVVLLWEAPNLAGRWRPRERWAFLAGWAVVGAFALLVWLHVGLPTLPDLTDHLLGRWTRRLLRPKPNIFW